MSVFSYGAAGDGVTDDAPALQKALNRASAIGGTLVVPRTADGYRLNDTVRPT